MAFKIKEGHWLVIIDFMEEHPDLAKGRLSVANAKDQFKKLWAELTHRLNSIGLGERTTEKWQKTWADYKCNLKKRAAEIKFQRNQTGGGPEYEKKLTKLDLRALNILGHTSYEGTGVPEKGLEYVCSPTSENYDICISTQPIPSSPNQPRSSKRRGEEDNDVSLYIEDHDYQATQPKLNKKVKKDNKENSDMPKEILLHMENLEKVIDRKLSLLNDTLDRHLSNIAERLQK